MTNGRRESVDFRLAFHKTLECSHSGRRERENELYIIYSFARVMHLALHKMHLEPNYFNLGFLSLCRGRYILEMPDHSG